MKKIILSMLLGVIATVTPLSAEHADNHTGKGHYYVIPKLLEIEGESYTHNGVTYKGRKGSGYGFDVGYSFAEHFAVELASSYSEDKVAVNSTEYDAKYLTYGIDLAYTHHITKHFGFLLKAGYGFEEEKVAALNNTFKEHGLTYAAGLEYGMSPRTEFVVEYEHALIESSRGASLYLGVKFKF